MPIVEIRKTGDGKAWGLLSFSRVPCAEELVFLEGSTFRVDRVLHVSQEHRTAPHNMVSAAAAAAIWIKPAEAAVKDS